MNSASADHAPVAGSKRADPEEVIQAERQRFSAVLETLPAYLILLTPDHHVAFANRFFRERFGESHGQRCFEYLFHRTEPCEVCETYKVLETKTPLEWQWTGPDGRHYHIYDFPFTDTDGSPLIMEMGIDITARKQVEAALQEAKETLEQRVAERTQSLRAANEQLQGQAEELRAANEELQAQQEELQAQTEELRAGEQSLRESEQRYHSLFENMLDGYAYCQMLFDRRGRPTDFIYLSVNEAFTRLTGLKNVVGKRATEVIPTIRTSHPELLETYGRVAKTGQAERFEIEFKPLGLWLSVSVYSPQRDYFIAVFDDITERKNAEKALQEANENLQGQAEALQAQGEELQTQTEELRAQTAELASANAALRKSEEGLRQRAEEVETLMKIAPVALWVSNDPQCNHIIGNPAADRFYEAYEQENVSANVSPVRRFFHEGRELTPEELPMQEAAAQNIDVRNTELDVLLPSGRWLNMLGSASPLRDAVGRVRGCIGAFVDITDRKRAEETLRELNASLESKVAQRTAELEHRARQLQKLTLELSQTEDRERKRMAEILHDDLQQIIAGAKFHVSLLRNRVRDEASLAAIAVRIDEMLREAVEKSRGLSHDLSPAVLYHGDLGQTFEWLARRMETQHGLTVRVNSNGGINIQSDAMRAFLYKAGQELLFNVVKHARVKEAMIRLRRFGRYVGLAVADGGRGFDPRGLKAAAGFGLLGIRERVELLGGHMKIKSAEGKGSTLIVVVPDEVSPDAAVRPKRRDVRVSAVSPRPDEALPTAGEHRLRVLLADDHEVVRQGLKGILHDEPDMTVVGEAANGREAVDLAWRLRPDAVIMDVSMPLLNGDEATRQIKAHLPDVRVIALSMYNEPERIETMHRAGAEAYVLKTAPSEELLAAIRGKKVDPPGHRPSGG